MKSTDLKPGKYYRSIILTIGLIISLSGLLIIIGWSKNIHVLQTFGLGVVPQKANLGFGFFLSGISLILLQYPHPFTKLICRALSIIIVILGILTSLEILFKFDFGIDNLLSSNSTVLATGTESTRMAFNAAISLVLIGIVQFVLFFEKRKFLFFIEFCLVVTFSISFLGLIGFIFGLAEFSESTGYTDMAIIATLLFIINCFGLFLTFFHEGGIRISIDQQLLAGLVFIGTAIVFLTLLSNSGFKAIRETSNDVQHTQTIKNYLNLLLADVIDVETGVRGYLISNNEDYLSPMIKAKTDLPVSLKELKLLFEGNQLQLTQLDSLENLILERVNHADLIYSEIRARGTEGGTVLFKTSTGKILTDKIRLLIDKMKNEENQILKHRNETEVSHSKKAQSILYLNLFVQMILLIVIFFIIRRNINQRLKALNEVRQLNENLESKVKERTASLARSEERFRSTLDNMMEGCQIIGFDWRYIYINKTAEYHNRRAKEELLGNRYMDMWPGVEDTEVFRIIKKSMEDRIFTHMENEFVFPDGSNGWFDLSIQPVPEGVFILSIDISEKKISENALKESEERFRTLFENSTVGIYRTTTDGKILLANPTLVKLLGYSSFEELANRNLDETGFEPSYERTHFIDLMIKEGEIRGLESAWTRRDGTSLYVSESARAIYNDKGEIKFFDGIVEDITLQKQAMDALNESEEKFRSIMENSADAIFLVDQKGQYVYTNRAVTSMLGYTQEEMKNKTIIDISPPEERDGQMQLFMDLINTGKLITEIRLIKKNGDIIYVDLNSVLIPGGLVYGSCRDITERKKVEEELAKHRNHLEELVSERTEELIIAKKEAEEANNAKSEFLANMSHEIRTPMNAVLGYTELLSSTIIDETQKNYINSIKTSGRSLLTLINDILDLSKIEAGKLELEYEFVNTNSFFTEFERIFSLKVIEKGLKFSLDITSGTPHGIYIDEARVRQIVFNLLGNAVKFTSEGSITLKVSTKNPQLVTYSKGNTEELIDLVIEVSDTGVGISKELQDFIFEPFTQERGYKQFGGTGLGLAITKKLVSLMNGSVSVESELGKGSKFIVNIPEIAYQREFESSNVEISVNPDEIEFEQGVILVVDDVEHNRKYLKDVLKNTNLKVIEAEDGFSALQLLKEMKPDLIIADIRMPEMDGFQLLSKIKEDESLKHIPVLAYSASVLKAQKERIHNSDFSGLLIKPVSITELYLSLINILPYKSLMKNESDLSLSKSDVALEISGLPDLIVKLETDFYEKWKTFAVTQPIEEIRDFGSDLLQLGISHNASNVKDYGNELINATQSFNIDSILRLLGKYQSLLENIKNFAKNRSNG